MTVPGINQDDTRAPNSRRNTIDIACRIFWWVGLLLLSPAFIAFFAEDAVFEFFQNYPTRVDRFLPTDFERFLFILYLGFGCWILCVVMRIVAAVIGGGDAESSHKKQKLGKRVLVFLVTTLVLCAALYIALILNIGIGLYYTPI